MIFASWFCLFLDFVLSLQTNQCILCSGRKCAKKKTNELAFKTMYFSKRDLSKNKSFQTANGKTASSHQVMGPTLN